MANPPGTYNASIDLGLPSTPNRAVNPELFRELLLIYFALQKLLVAIEQGDLAGVFTSITSLGDLTVAGTATVTGGLAVTGDGSVGGNSLVTGDQVILGTSTITGLIIALSNMVVPKVAGYGIKVDTATPTFGWRDLEGPIVPKVTGAGHATWTVWSGNISEWAFALNDVCDSKFHWPHDWVPGTDVFLHVHWSHNGTAIAGTLTVISNYVWGKGHHQQVYDAEKTILVTEVVTNIAGHPALETFITEVQLSSSSPSAAQIDTAQLEPDGLLKLHSKVTSIPTVTGGALFIEYIDIHYQSSNVGTKQKAPNFYV